MALPQSFLALVGLLTTLAWGASMRLPSFPLAVKTPYLSVWMPGHRSHDFPNASPQFWEGQELTWIVLARINSTTYCLMGCPGGRPGTTQATQKSLNFTSTHTYVTLEAGSVELTLDFFSPVDPVDHIRQSLPFSYLTVSAVGKHGTRPDVGLATAIDASWLSDRGSPYVEFDKGNESNILILDGRDGREFSEEREMALWGKVVLASESRSKSEMPLCQVGSPGSLFQSFFKTGSLDHSTGFRETMDINSLAACTHYISSSKKESHATFAVGLYQDNEMQYFDGNKIEYYVGYFRSKLSTLRDAVVHFLHDYKDALAASFELDKQIIKMGKETSSNYSDLLEFAVRQSFAGQQVMINNDTLDTTHPYAFIKEISTDGNVNTLADLIPKALPVFHVLNPNYTRMFLEPVLRFSANAWPLNHAVHDIGKAYPNATGETPCIEEFLPLDSTSVLLWMVYLYVENTGDTQFALDYMPILQRYADYCHRYGLYPVLQRSSVDALGSATNQSALSVSAAIALNAFGALTGQSDYSDIGRSFAKQILDIGTDSNQTHFLTHYSDEDAAWVLMYPLAFDAWLRLDTFPESVHLMQSEWYSQNTQPFGVQFRNNIDYTLMEWQMWVAAVSLDNVRNLFVDAVHRFLDQDTGPRESVPGPTQWRVVPGPYEGVWTHFSKAKSVVGSIFMIAAVERGIYGSSGPTRRPALLQAGEPPAATQLVPETLESLITYSEMENISSEPAFPLGIPFEVPAGASKPVARTFLGLSFDTAAFPLYIGNTSAPITKSFDLIRNLATLSGGLLTIRIGSAEGDEGVFDPIQLPPVKRIKINGRSTLSIGPSLFDGIRALGSSITQTDYLLQVPFAKMNVINAVQGIKVAMDAVPPRRLSALEIGHKPNLLAGKARPDNYGCQAYAAELFAFKVGLGAGISRIREQFQALGLSHRHIDESWTMEECFTAGIEAQEDLRTVSVHYSHFEDVTELRNSGLPRHYAIVREHDAFLPQVRYMRDVFPCHPFVISEAGLVSGSNSQDHADQKKLDDEQELNVALWNLDFLLYSMSKNVSKVLMHQSCESVSSAWTPAGCASSGRAEKGDDEIKAPYSALTFVASFIGGTYDFRVVALQESDDSIVYAGYEGGELSKIAIVNYLSSDESVEQNVDLRLPLEVTALEETARLNIGTITAGYDSAVKDKSVFKSDVQAPIHEDSRMLLRPSNGQLTMPIGSGEAVLLTVRSKPRHSDR